jgi:collagen beta-1,O-galactosyltransferase
MDVFVINLKRRPDRRERMERILPPAWNAEYTTNWSGPLDGSTIDAESLRGFGLFPWRIESDNPWWNRPLKLGEIGCAVSHWLCWKRAHENGADVAVIFEDDVVLEGRCADRLPTELAKLTALDPHWDLAYLGRWPLEPDLPAAYGIVRPGYSYCTYGYALSAPGLQKVLAAGFERALVPVDEFLPAMYVDHPRLDVRRRYPKRMAAYAFEPRLVTQLPKEDAGSDTEASDFVSPGRGRHVSRVPEAVR